MSIVTQIEIQQKNKERVNIYIDNQFFLGVNAEIVYDLKLKKGDEVDEDKLKSLIKRESLSKAKNKAMSILNRTAISEKKLREKLSDFDEEIIDEVIFKLKDYGFINDKDLAKRIASDNSNISRFGKNKIRQNLYRKGINKEDIDLVVNDLDYNTQYENALYLAHKRYKNLKNEDSRVIYQKLTQHLAYKGFDYDIIKSVINEILSN